MQRYSHMGFSTSFTKSLQAMQPHYDQLTTSDMVIIEEDTTVIDHKLQDAENRLKMLSRSKKDSTTKAKQYLRSIEKSEKSKNMFNRLERKLIFSPKKKSRIDQIREHLDLLQYEIDQKKRGERQTQAMSTSKQKQLKNQITILESKIQKLQKDRKKEKKEQEEKWIEKLSQIQKQNHKQIQMLRKQQQQQARQLKLNVENSYLHQQQKLVNQISLLSANLQMEIGKYNGLKSQVNNIQQQHVKKICQLEAQVENLQLEIERHKDEFRMQKQLKTQLYNKTKELESQNKLIRDNNRRFTLEINQSKQLTQQIAKQILSIYEPLIYLLEILNKQCIQLPHCLTSARSQLSQKKSVMKQRICEIKSKYSLVDDPCQRNTSFSTEHSFNCDKENINHLNIPTNRKYVKSIQSYLEEPMPEEEYLYKLLLIQAQSIERKVS